MPLSLCGILTSSLLPQHSGHRKAAPWGTLSFQPLTSQKAWKQLGKWSATLETDWNTGKEILQIFKVQHWVRQVGTGCQGQCTLMRMACLISLKEKNHAPVPCRRRASWGVGRSGKECRMGLGHSPHPCFLEREFSQEGQSLRDSAQLIALVKLCSPGNWPCTRGLACQ